MSKSEYVNYFSLIKNHISSEVILTVFNESPIINEKFETESIERDEVIKLVMTDYNLRELHKVISDVLKSGENQ